MLYVSWAGKQIELTHHAYRELNELGLDMFDVSLLLDESFNCSRSRRDSGTYERCVAWGSGLIRIVLKENDHICKNGSILTILKLVHIGKECLKQEKYHNEN